MMKRNLTYHHHSLNQMVEKNLADKCIPIDYFIERMLQIGICSSMTNLRKFVDLMLVFDNSGFVSRGPDNMPSYIETPLNQSAASESEARGERSTNSEGRRLEKQKPLNLQDYEKVPWEQPYTDDFIPMNYPSRDTARFL